MLCVVDRSADCVWRTVPERTEWQRIGDEIKAATIFERSHFVDLKEVSSMMDEIDPRQPFLRVNILRWREIFRMIETSGGNVDLIGAFVGLIG